MKRPKDRAREAATRALRATISAKLCVDLNRPHTATRHIADATAALRKLDRTLEALRRGTDPVAERDRLGEAEGVDDLATLLELAYPNLAAIEEP